MPLPNALAARLAKRGILNRVEKLEKEKARRDFKGVTSCPNKTNPYHDCSHWCEIHWKTIASPDTRYIRNVSKLLIRYPLPRTWTEVYDKGLGTYYFWDMETDLVSWLPPRHPKAFLSESASKLREKRAHGKLEEGPAITIAKHEEERKSEKKRSSKSSDSHHRRRKDHSSSNKRKRVEEDPMDPSSYSDILPGTWSDGLENHKSADSTASGVLYQSRPYPPPGEVLVNNKTKPKQKKNVNFGSVTYCN